MSAAITDVEVRSLLRLDATVDVSNEVSAANLQVDEDLATSGYSVERFRLIKLYLAAHLYTIAVDKGGLVQERVGQSEETYSGVNSSAKGLSRTLYGQQVMSLDSQGILASKGAGSVKAKFRVV